MFSFLKEFFYLQQSDRKVILTLLAVAAVALGGGIFYWQRQRCPHHQWR